MKVLLAVLTALFVTHLSAQNIRLTQKWASPRAGDDIEFTAERKTANGTQKFGDFRFPGLTKDTGWKWVGPLSLKIGDSLYQSDSIRVHVIDSLPALRNGLWVRFETINDELFLITEQRISLNTSVDLEDESALFAKIDGYGIKEKGLKIGENSSQWYHKPVNIGGEVIFIPYMMTLYKVQMSANFDGEYLMKKEDFLRWPENVDFPKIVITR